MQSPAIAADRYLAEQRIVDVHLFHFGNDGFAVLGTAKFLDRFKIGHGRRIDAGLDHVRHCTVSFHEPFRPCAGVVVLIPIKRFGQG